MRVKISTVVALLSFCAVPAVWAAPVTVIVHGIQDSFADPDSLLPFADSGNGTAWSMTVTYESDTPDVTQPMLPPGLPDFDPSLGIYAGALTDAQLIVDGNSFDMLSGSSVLIIDDAVSTSGDTVDFWMASTSTRTAVSPVNPVSGEPDYLDEGFRFFMSATAPAGQPVPVLTSDELVPPAAMSSWDMGSLKMNYRITYEDNSGLDPVDTDLALATATITSITVVPLPAAAWLFLSGFLSLIGLRTARKAAA